ncbi:MAG: DUF5717 family protein [Clostridium sp.]|nr:DUF5717 family protein [Acetatifactor muris]MCM1527080.1 DUF5717 family protein [Bacteroides sp.]MCM1562056.1 DUF5717 family protein [Clostridium sp.]
MRQVSGMQEIVDRILEGKYDYENGSLDFSCAKLELSMRRGEVIEGSFHVSATDGSFAQGYVTATDVLMECLTPEFAGGGEEIFYRFHGGHLEEGDVVRGNFVIVSNRGEYNLPFVVSVEHQTLTSSIGNIKNLFHFANLAKSDWQEAVDLFYTPEFAEIFQGSDRQFYDCYRGLSVYPGNGQNVEEFLVRVNKKQRVEFPVQEDRIEIAIAGGAYGVMETELHISKNGWGYTSLQVECEGEFVFTEKEILSEDDFLGSHCTLPVFIDPQLCRQGRNFGMIYIYNSHTSVSIPVTVCRGEGQTERREKARSKQETVRLMECYRDFRLRKISSGVWMKETGALVENMVARDGGDVAARLFKAQLLISGERYNEAELFLEHAGELLERADGGDDTLYAYYLYLTTLVRGEEDHVSEVVSEVERLYHRDRNNWRIAWLLLYLSEKYNKTAAAKWDFLEQQFQRGCTSPVLYIEGLHLLNGNATVLRKLDDYALQVLHYGVRYDALGADVTDQVLYLTGKGREYSGLLVRILQTLYGRRKDVHILQEICGLLVRGGCVGNRFLEWYEAGVEARLRITNLYEYYMMSVDPDGSGELPKSVLLYFSYRNNLDLARSAFLYRYVARHRDELGEIYESYRPAMEHFVVDQIQKGRINRHLAGLYQELLAPAMIDEQTAKPLSKLLMAHQIRVEDLRLKKVIVYQPGNLRENVYPLQDGGAWVPLYGNDSTILFEDAYGNRFVKDVEYTLEKLMMPGKFLRLVSPMVTDSVELDIFLSEGETDLRSGEVRERAARLAENEWVDARIRRELYLKLLDFYYETDDMRALDDCLAGIPTGMFTLAERARILHYMTLRGRGEDAWERIMEFGPAFVEPRTLMRLVSERIRTAEGCEDRELAGIALHVFRQGRYDSQIVQYLSEYARCSTRELRDIWKAARSFETDAYRLSERMLLQMLFSGAFVGEKTDIFAYYVSHGANVRVERAFLAYCAYDYFVKDRLTEELFFKEIRNLYLQREETGRICKLAFLKYYAENTGSITEEITPIIGDFLSEMLSEKIHLNFFRRYAELNPVREDLLREMLDKTIVEYRARPGAKAYIHYVIMREDGEASEYLTEPMREVAGGLCFKELVLFFGESLQYYIMEEKDGGEQLTESGNLQKSDIRSNNADWRYEMLNDILISKTLEDFDTLDSLLDEYRRREYLGEHLFALQ